MPQIFYKFKSSKNHEAITFDSLEISTSDLKQEIAQANKLTGDDFDLKISNAQTGEGNSFVSSLHV